MAVKRKIDGRKVSSSAEPRPNILFRCIRPGMGCGFRGHRDVASLEQKPTEVACQHERIGSCPYRVDKICRTDQREGGSSPFGQCNGSVTYSKQGGTHSFSLYKATRILLLWLKQNQTQVLTRFVQGKLNIRADLLSCRKQVISTECTLHPMVCRQMWKCWGIPLVDLFATAKNNRLPIYCSSVPDFRLGLRMPWFRIGRIWTCTPSRHSR